MESLSNLDLLSVGIAIAGIGLLGFMVLFNNKKSITNRTFFFFTVFGILWAIFNYAYQKFSIPEFSLLFLRLHALFAVLYVYFLFQTFFVFPREKVKFPSLYKKLLIPFVIFVALLTLTPFVFKEITGFTPEGKIASVENGFGIAFFGLLVVGLIISGPIMLLRRFKEAEKNERKQFSFVLIGALLTFSLHIIFNFIFPAFFNNPRFISLGGVFIIPVVVFTSYAIFRHHLLSVKVITTEIMAFILAVVTLFEVVLSENTTTLVFRSGIFLLVLGFSILLIKSVLREVEQREELAKINIELRKAKVELEKLSQFKSQMLRLASHQIKSPLATIKQFATILIEGLYGPVSDKVKVTLGKMKESSEELIKLINDLLDLGKIEQGKMDYKFESIKLKDLVQNVVDGLRVQADTKKLQLTFSSTTEGNVSADSQKLKQVLQNLTENAIKFTLQGFVKVEVNEDNGFLIFSTFDSGPGIVASRLPKLFDQELVRDERPEYKNQSTGTGLYIAKKIVTDHGGTIWAESDGEGKGSRFYVKLRKV